MSKLKLAILASAATAQLFTSSVSAAGPSVEECVFNELELATGQTPRQTKTNDGSLKTSVGSCDQDEKTCSTASVIIRKNTPDITIDVTYGAWDGITPEGTGAVGRFVMNPYDRTGDLNRKLNISAKTPSAQQRHAGSIGMMDIAKGIRECVRGKAVPQRKTLILEIGSNKHTNQ